MRQPGNHSKTAGIQAGGTALLGVLQMERRLRAFEKDITERKLHTDGLAHR
ncbi:MAG: hypothetical protein HFG04_00915 [Oscillibacter sp.]|nr:hypothetical protein [Oscillibacter sp.]